MEKKLDVVMLMEEYRKYLVYNEKSKSTICQIADREHRFVFFGRLYRCVLERHCRSRNRKVCSVYPEPCVSECLSEGIEAFPKEGSAPRLSFEEESLGLFRSHSDICWNKSNDFLARRFSRWGFRWQFFRCCKL